MWTASAVLFVGPKLPDQLVKRFSGRAFLLDDNEAA